MTPKLSKKRIAKCKAGLHEYKDHSFTVNSFKHGTVMFTDKVKCIYCEKEFQPNK